MVYCPNALSHIRICNKTLVEMLLAFLERGGGFSVNLIYFDMTIWYIMRATYSVLSVTLIKLAVCFSTCVTIFLLQN